MTSGSATGFLFLTIVLLKFLSFKNLIPIILTSTLIFAIINSYEIIAANRTFQIFIATLTFDEASIIEADHSGSIRIVPIIILIKLIDLSTMDGWLGHGIDYVSTFLSYSLPGLQDNMSSGGLMVFCMEYGFLLFCVFIFFSIKLTVNKNYFNFIFWFFLVFMYNINSQIMWLCIILLYTNNYFLKNRFDK
jgi:hypothetical protein